MTPIQGLSRQPNEAASLLNKFRDYDGSSGEAKREETRQSRLATAIEWIAEGKQRNWKYQNK